MKKLITSFLLIFCSLLAISFIAGSPFIFSDGYGYYHVAKTLVEQGTFASNVKPDYYYYSAHTTNTFDDRYVTVYSSADAVLTWPFMTVAKAFDQGTIYDNYYKAYNGHSLADGLALEIAACFYATILILVLYRFLRDLKFSKKISLAGTAISLIAAYVFGYVIINTSYSHIYEVLSFSIVLFAVNRYRISREQKNNGEEIVDNEAKNKNVSVKIQKIALKNLNIYLVIAGIAAGFLVLSRPADIVILVPIFFYLLAFRNFKAVVNFILGGIPIALIYFLYNYQSFHSILANGYKILWNADFDFSRFNLGSVLFSDVRGWFVYSPIVILAIAGLIIYCKKDFKKYLLYVVPILLLVLLYSFWPSWWAGDSIGQRFFLVLAPIVAVGISALLVFIKSHKSNLLRKSLYVLIFVLTLYSAGVLILTRITDVGKLNEFNSYTAAVHPEVSPAERFTPFDIYGYQINLITQSKDLNDYWNNLTNYFEYIDKDKSLLQLMQGYTIPVVKVENVSLNSFKINIIPNTINKNLNATIKVYINRNGVQKKLELKDIDTSKYTVIQFTCNVDACINNYPNKAIFTDDKTFQDNELIHVNSPTSVRLESDQQLLFIDYKLENFKIWFVK